MATTPNFNWSTPDNTGLVKNGALDIRTLGNSIDASMADLKGGTTGQVLSKASNTDMDFVWAADAGAPTSLGYSAGKNQCINGAFNVWQRGTSFGANVYTADRWTTQTDKTLTVSQQTFTPGTAPVAGYEGTFFLRKTYTASGNYGALQTKLEDVRLFAGQTITLSYWAKADATFSNTPSVSQNFGSGGSGGVGTNGTTHNITTTWTRYSSVINVPSISGKTIGTSSFFMLQPILIESTGARTIDIWGVQVEIGSTLTAFQTASGSVQGELALCQRYFYRMGGLINYEYFGIGTSVSAGTAIGYISPKVTLRGTPTLTFTTASNYRVVEGTSSTTATSVNAEELSANNVSYAFNASGFTIGRATRMISNNTINGYIDISAEL